MSLKEAKEEKKEIKQEEKVIEKRKEKLFHWFKNREHLLLFIIILFALAIRIYFFVQTVNQPVWWDEADYLIRAKYYATGLEKFNDFSPRKPLLMSVFWGGLYALGANELILRLTELILSILGIYLTFVVGKKLFNAKVGLIAAFILSIWWSYIFYTYRLLLDVPTLVASLLSIMLFADWVEKQKIKYLLLCGIVTGAGVMLHYFIGLLPLSYLIFLILTKRETFKSKQLYIALLIGIIALSPFLIWMGLQFGNPLHSFISYFKTSPLVKGSCDPGYPCGWSGYLSNIPTLFGLQFFGLFILGLAVLLINLFLSFDFIIKEKDKKYRWDLFILLTILVTVGFVATVQQNFEDRYMFMAMPLIFFITAQGTIFIYDTFKKYSNVIKVIVIIALLAFFIWGTYGQLAQANSIIELKKISYLQVKQAGEWLKQNVDDNSVILTTSNRHLLYYSGKNVFLVSYLDENFAKGDNSCYEMANISYYKNKIVEKQEPQSLTFIKKEEITNCYLVLTAFEPSTPEWVYKWPQSQQERFEPIQAWFFDEEQQHPAVIIYKFKRV